MRIRDLHLLSSHLLLVAGTTILWAGDSRSAPPYPIAVALCSVAAFFVTDRWGWVRLPHLLSNLLAVGIVVLLIREFRAEVTDYTLVLGHFLAYLQVVKTFREKRDADYWLLYTLNLLQVAIGCVGNPSVSAAWMLLGYGLLAVWTVSLFWLTSHEANVRRFDERMHRPPTPERPIDWGVLRPLRGQSALVLLLTLPLALGVFWTIPRYGKPRFTAGTVLSSGPALAGFTPSVRLEDMTNILQASGVALEVQATNRAGDPIALPPELSWKGTVLNEYEDRSWQRRDDVFRVQAGPIDRGPMGPQSEVAVLRVIQQVPAGRALFAPRGLMNASIGYEDVEVVYDYVEGRLRVQDSSNEIAGSRAIEYEIVVDLACGDSPDDMRSPSFDYRWQACLGVPESQAGLIEYANDLVDDLPVNDARGRIARLVSHLRDSGEFQYDLQTVAVSPGSDPIEDFLLRRKRGHCEYFASSLALMLRAVGVPCRIVNGFRGVEEGDAPGHYLVPQRFAHSWVEAYLIDEDRWVTLDATPDGYRAARPERGFDFRLQTRNLLTRIATFWETYIVGYSEFDQRMLLSNLADRLQRFVLTALDRVTRPDFWLGPGGVSVLAVGLIGWFGGRPAWRWYRRRHWLRQHQRRGLGVGPIAAVYLEWLEVLERHGWSRGVSETAGEFAHRLTRELPRDGDPSLAEDLANLHYDYRYGGREPAEQSLGTLQQRVDSFRQHLGTAARPKRTSGAARHA